MNWYIYENLLKYLIYLQGMAIDSDDLKRAMHHMGIIKVHYVYFYLSFNLSIIIDMGLIYRRVFFVMDYDVY